MGFTKFRKKASTATKKRYGIGKGRGGFKFTQVAKDLEMIKSRLNVEKKFVDQDLYNDQTVGQSNDESPGDWHVDLTPLVAQGVGESNRIGNSIKATGMVVRMNFRGQTNAGKRVAKICIIRSLNEDSSPVADLWDPNPLTGFIDFHSPRNYASMRGKSSSHTVIATKYVKIASGNDEDPVASLMLPVKLNDVIRYGSNSDNTPEDFRYHMVVFLDYGNKALSGTTSNLGCVIPTAASGVVFNQQVRLWYVDN